MENDSRRESIHKEILSYLEEQIGLLKLIREEFQRDEPERLVTFLKKEQARFREQVLEKLIEEKFDASSFLQEPSEEAKRVKPTVYKEYLKYLKEKISYMKQEARSIPLDTQALLSLEADFEYIKNRMEAVEVSSLLHEAQNRFEKISLWLEWLGR